MTTTTVRGAPWNRFRGGFQGEYLAGISEHLERLSWTTDQIRFTQAEGLQKLLAHAVQRSPFHRERLAGIDVSRIDPADLSSLPVMTKEQMTGAFDEVVTDPRLDRGLVERTIGATEGEPVPIFDDYVAFATGGSSGQRGLFVYDRSATAGFLLSVTRSLVSRLQNAGGPPPEGFHIAMVGAASAVHLTRAAAACTEGSDMPIHIRSVPVTLPLEEIVQRLDALRAPGLFGYPSMLVRLAAEKHAGRLNLSPAVVTTTAETLLPETADTISETFGAPVVNNFACTEGLVGNSAPGDSVLMFNSDMCIIEPVDELGRPTRPGERSARVLLTNLYNFAQPLIRYELNDSFVPEPSTADQGHFRARVQGRADEVLHYRGLDVHPHVIRSVLVKFPEILDYRVEQTQRGIDVVAVTMGVCDTALVSTRLAEALAGAGLPSPDATIRLVNSVERHAESGKLRRFVPLTLL